MASSVEATARYSPAVDTHKCINSNSYSTLDENKTRHTQTNNPGHRINAGFTRDSQSGVMLLKIMLYYTIHNIVLDYVLDVLECRGCAIM